MMAVVSERIAPDAARERIVALAARLPKAHAAPVLAILAAWPPEDPLSAGYDVIQVTAGCAEKHVRTLWLIAYALHYMKAWLDYHAGATDERASAKGGR